MLMALAAAALAQPAGRGVISGTVVDAASGDPVRKAVITLTWQGTPRSWATLRTDESGSFRFGNLPPGKYDLRARKEGVGLAVYGAQSVRELGELISLGENETRTGLKLRFLHSGSISGHVVDDQGDPAAGAVIRLLRVGRNRGARILVNQQTAIADDRGEYRINGIDPGEYYARAAANGPFPGGQLLLDVFYGDTRESKEASPIRIRGGESLTGIDFHLMAAAPAHISMHVTGVPKSDEPRQPERIFPNQFIQVRAASVDDSETQRNFGVPEQNASFQLPPGQYRLQASTRSGNLTYAVAQIFDLHSGENEIELALAPAIEIKGQIRVEGLPGPRPGAMQVMLAPPGIRGSNIAARAGEDGRFTLSQVIPGEWEIDVTGVPRGSYLKSVRYGDKDVSFAPFEIAGADNAISIVVSTNASKIEGEVDSANGDASRAGIIVAPVGRLHDFARFYYGAAADDEGKFKLEGLAPGKYKIFALEKMAPAGFGNPEAADQLGSLGEDIELVEGKTLEVHPKLIPQERAREALP